MGGAGRWGNRVLIAVTLAGLVGSAEFGLEATTARAGVSPPQGFSEPFALADRPQVPSGADISYPQCGAALPFGRAFGVVGVNGGRADTLNPCLSEELAWAVEQTTGASPQPRASVYLNTGDPGTSYLGQPVPDWPRSGDSPDGSCLPQVALPHVLGPGQTSVACAWVFGFMKAEQDTIWLGQAAALARLPSKPAQYPFWLDVETSNTWQDSTSMNQADLEGMVAALRVAGVTRIGVYASPQQWLEIAGASQTSSSGPLYPLQSWILGAGSQGAAQNECQGPPLTGGKVLLAQFPLGPFDGDVAC
ncbi:MAG TPA: hypothetical protein VNH20_07800 [Candidatus Dormibacteraeota bacterium]|nr:hypothetical protein [Candidatus Dormibacteraeota bacterium]